MHFLWTIGLRSSSPTSRFLLLKRFQSTRTTSQNTKSLFTYGKGGHYFLDRIDPNESVRIPHRDEPLSDFRMFCINKNLCCIEILKNFDCQSR